MSNTLDKLRLVQVALKAPKNQRNNFGKYNYRSCEDILEAVKPLLSEHGLTVTIKDGIEAVGDRIYVKATVFVNGEEMGSGFAREEESKKGMDASQLTGSCSSYARKYALNGVFLIDDTKDADATNTHGKSQPEQSATPPAAKPKAMPNKDCEKWEDWKVKGETTLQDIIKEMLPDDVGGADDEDKVIAFETEKAEKLAKAKAFYENKANEAKTDADAEYWQKGVEFTNQAITAFEKNPF